MITNKLSDVFKEGDLLLTRLDLSHNNFIMELVNSDNWKKYIGDRNIQSLIDSENYIKKINSLPETFYWVVSHNDDDNNPMGIITLMKRDYLENYDLGFAFLDQFTGKGLAYKSAQLVINQIKKLTDLKFLVAITLKENSKSIQLLEKLNFSFSKEFIKEGENLFLYELKLK